MLETLIYVAGGGWLAAMGGVLLLCRGIHLADLAEGTAEVPQ